VQEEAPSRLGENRNVVCDVRRGPALAEKKGCHFGFGFADTLMARTGGITLYQLHSDARGIVKAFESMEPLAKRLGVPAPVPRLAGFCYTHVSTFGGKIICPEDSEPTPTPVIKTPEDIENLEEPKNYLETPLIKKRLEVLEELRGYRPDAPKFIGHLLEGPITTAVMLMGPDFLVLPYDNPEIAHRFLSFCTESALNYADTISNYFGQPIVPGEKWIPDDFAGMFPPALFEEFVIPYWDRMYKGLKATERHLHSELLRKEHLHFLKELNIKTFDPSADQYVTPEILAEYCPCDFTLRIQSWEIINLSAAELEERYLYLQKHNPISVSFYMDFAEEEPKIKRLLNLARKMEEEGNE
jgi:hypothetical protein